MGLEAARYMDREKKKIVLAGRTLSKLNKAVAQLENEGIEAYGHVCDTSDRESIRSLAEYAKQLGCVKNVIHAAGLSPAMALPEQLLRVNSLGTVYVNQEFSKVMDKGSVIVDIASNSAYVLPRFLIREKVYQLAESNEEQFMQKCLKLSNLARGDYEKSGLAYAISKNFTIWYAKKSAFILGEKGIRVVSLSPGLIATDMGNLEAEEGKAMLKYGAQERMGTAQELGFAIASVADERNGYLSGVDVLCDGGCTTGKHFKNYSDRKRGKKK